jgi:6-pyruvoyltetrahydropterin/6-carboxytetrahydropterin synthase
MANFGTHAALLATHFATTTAATPSHESISSNRKPSLKRKSHVLGETSPRGKPDAVAAWENRIPLLQWNGWIDRNRNGAMFEVTRELRFCYGHRLLQYEGKCRHLHGHNGRAVLTFAAPSLDQLGMVLDFSRIKKAIGGWIDMNLDHRMILHRDDPILPEFRRLGEPVFLTDVNPTAETIARLIFEHAAGEGFPVTQVSLWETDDAYATFRRS